MTGRPRARAVIFDFNGTLSDDEPVLLLTFTELFLEHLGWQMTAADYYERLAGRSDREIVETAVSEQLGLLTEHASLVEVLLSRRRDRYLELVADECPIPNQTQELVHALVTAGCPVGIVTGAQRADVDFVLSHSSVGGHFEVVVTEEDVTFGKPDPEGFLRGAALLAMPPGQVLVFEDSVAGVRAATAAGMRCVGLVGTHTSQTLAAEGVPTVETLSRELVALL
jgi:beta-phosphoglucomutase-like phosphatase (HAD superfamily)